MKMIFSLLVVAGLLCQSCQVSFVPPAPGMPCGNPGMMAPFPPMDRCLNQHQLYQQPFGVGDGGWLKQDCGGGGNLVYRRITTTTWNSAYPCGSPGCVPRRHH